MNGTYGAAAGDISPDISGGLCFANIDMANCQYEAPIASYVGPACPTSNCGLCYQVTNLGGYGGAQIGGSGNSVMVQIIDSCPSVSAWNYCKTEVPTNERCGNPQKNSMDIDQSAYAALTGVDFDWGVPNLNIAISPVACP
ncbi:hypothetical protein MMC15_006654 [Xylographa vitiligo]|nr:hypothetical protein [Xylographa vitiligo]